LRGSALEESAGVNWATVRKKHLVLAQGTGQIAVLASTIEFVYRRMKTDVSLKTSFFHLNSKEWKKKCVFCYIQSVKFAIYL
jgi:hypothetical protein